MINFFEFLSKNFLTPNGLYRLYSIKHNVAYGLAVNNYAEDIKLINSEFIITDEKGNNVITEKGEQILQQVSEKFFTETVNTEKQNVNTENVKKYLEMFPKGFRKDGSKIAYRAPLRELEARFKWFFKMYPEYDWDLVLQTTEIYMDMFESGSQDYKYLACSHYFIKKGAGADTKSTLAMLCEMVKNGEDLSSSATDGRIFYQ